MEIGARKKYRLMIMAMALLLAASLFVIVMNASKQAMAAPDSTVPTVSDISPSDYISSDSPTISANYSDDTSGSGINSATAYVYLDGSVSPGCIASATKISCSTSGLGEGPHSITVGVRDNAGNLGTGTGSFGIDMTPPAVTYVGPIGTVNTFTPTIIGIATDYWSPVVSATISIDGGEPVACGYDVNGIVFCTPGSLPEGIHTACIVGTDAAGNTNTTGLFSFIVTAHPCDGWKPILMLCHNGPPVPTWDSYSDYLADILSINWSIYNAGTNDALSVTMTNVSNGSGVSNYGPASVSYGDIPAGATVTCKLQYHGARTLTSYHTAYVATSYNACGAFFTYP